MMGDMDDNEKSEQKQSNPSNNLSFSTMEAKNTQTSKKNPTLIIYYLAKVECYGKDGQT